MLRKYLSLTRPRRARALALATLAVAAVGFAPSVATADPVVTAFTTSTTTNGVPDMRAGAHPDLNLRFTFASRPDPSSGFGVTNANLKDLDLDLPLGTIGNPTVLPTCRQADLQASTCPVAAQVGVAQIDFGGGPQETPVYNMVAPGDRPARLGMFIASTVPVMVDFDVLPSGGLRASLRNVNQALGLIDVDMTIWGVPALAAHDAQRYDGFTPGSRAGVAPKAFLSNPTRCDDEPLTAALRATSWQRPGDESRATATNPGGPVTGCDDLPFAPTLDVAAGTQEGNAPAGYAIDLAVPQSDSPSVLQTASVKDATVVLPEGSVLNPSTADGLSSCTDAQFGKPTTDPASCPPSAQIGDLEIETPLLDTPITGKAYIGQQLSSDPESGEMYRLFLLAEGRGVRIKLLGNIRADAKTGRLTATFRNNPQLPFSNLHLEFKGGSRAPLVTPPTCGDHTTTSTIDSWGGQSVTSTSSFRVTDCRANTTFAPTLDAGTISPLAGAFSPFTTTFRRTDNDQDMNRIALQLPQGLLGSLGSVPVCAEAQAAAGTCGAGSRIGGVTVAAGTGATPLHLPGNVFLGGPYKGAPFSLSIVVRAVAGPFDLGTVVVRAPLAVDAAKAQASVISDPLPTILGGVPLHYRMINVTLDRPGFMFNATNCTPSAVRATVYSPTGATAASSTRYQPQGCASLKLDPSIKLTYSGKADLKKGRNPKLTADLGQTFGQAGLKQVRVMLPLVSSLQAKNAKALCTPAQAAARACPAASIVGRASATTPALHEPLTGPVYFLEGTRKTASGKVVPTLPKLWLKLEGDGVPLDLRADSANDNATGRLITTFTDIPDAPIANFKLEIDGGKNGILAAVRDPCTANTNTDVQYDGQNGARVKRTVAITAPECGVRASMNATASQVRVKFTGIAGGRLSVAGKGLATKKRTIKSSTSATVVAKLSASVRRRIASGRTVKLRLTATFDPKAKGKTTKITKTVTIKGAKRRR